jgi:hypothetical protein
VLRLPHDLAGFLLKHPGDLQIDDKTGNAMYTLRQTYQKHLLPYEAYGQQRMDPEADKKSKGKRAASSSAPSRFDAMLAAVDDAAEAAEILESLMSRAEGDEPPFKRLKSEDVKCGVRIFFWLTLLNIRARTTVNDDRY